MLMQFFCVWLSRVMLCNCLVICFLFARLFGNIGEFGAKEYFTSPEAANTVHLVVDITGNFSEPFYSF